MREEYLGAINERNSIMSEFSQDLEDLHDDILYSSSDEENLKEPMEE
jgi:hypothetical protein